jgi:hypothetical protein
MRDGAGSRQAGLAFISRQPHGRPRAVIFWLRFAHLFASSYRPVLKRCCLASVAGTNPGYLRISANRWVVPWNPWTRDRYSHRAAGLSPRLGRPTRIFQAPQSLLQRKRDGLEPRVPHGGATRARIRPLRNAGIKAGRKSACVVKER